MNDYKLVKKAINKYYSHLKNDMDDVIQTVFTLGYSEDLEYIEKLRIIGRAAYLVSKDLGYQLGERSYSRREKTNHDFRE